MAEANDVYGSIYQNLIDAGCDTKITEQCITLVVCMHNRWLLMDLWHWRLIPLLEEKAATLSVILLLPIFLLRITVLLLITSDYWTL